MFESFRGPHFTLIGSGANAVRELANVVWPTQGAALRRVAAESKAFRRAYGVSRDTLILVRPDGYIATIANHDRVASVNAASLRYMRTYA